LRLSYDFRAPRLKEPGGRPRRGAGCAGARAPTRGRYLRSAPSAPQALLGVWVAASGAAEDGRRRVQGTGYLRRVFTLHYVVVRHRATSYKDQRPNHCADCRKDDARVKVYDVSQNTCNGVSQNSCMMNCLITLGRWREDLRDAMETTLSFVWLYYTMLCYSILRFVATLHCAAVSQYANRLYRLVRRQYADTPIGTRCADTPIRLSEHAAPIRQYADTRNTAIR
jgi:hypothetical protein